MAIPDLLWACPLCGKDRGLASDGAGFRCRGCGTAFRRGRGATIEALHNDGSRTVRTPAQWLTRIPDPQSLVLQHDAAKEPIRRSKVSTRWVTGQERVMDEDGFLNRIEVWGDKSPGTLELWPDRLVHTVQAGPGDVWAFEDLRAVQASSSSVQINRVDAPLVSFQFPDDSIFLWEQLIHAALQAFYRRTGRGSIVEFQPRIVTQ